MTSDTNEEKRLSFEELSALSAEFLSDCQEIVLSRGIPGHNDGFLCGCLYVRCVTLFYSLRELALKGHVVGASIILRVLFEAAVYLEACATNEEARDAYLAMHASGRKKLLNKIRSSKTEWMKELTGEITSERAEEIQETAESAGSTWTVERFAKSVGMENWYITAYSITSGDIHSTPASVERAFVVDKDGQPVIGEVGPQDEPAQPQLCHGALILAFAKNRMVALLEGDSAKCPKNWVETWASYAGASPS